jgi:hypothetical protein
MDSASVTMKSVAQILSEWSFLIALKTTEGLLIDPIPEINEVFKITIV